MRDGRVCRPLLALRPCHALPARACQAKGRPHRTVLFSIRFSQAECRGYGSAQLVMACRGKRYPRIRELGLGRSVPELADNHQWSVGVTLNLPEAKEFRAPRPARAPLRPGRSDTVSGLGKIPLLRQVCPRHGEHVVASSLDAFDPRALVIALRAARGPLDGSREVRRSERMADDRNILHRTRCLRGRQCRQFPHTPAPCRTMRRSNRAAAQLRIPCRGMRSNATDRQFPVRNSRNQPSCLPASATVRETLQVPGKDAQDARLRYRTRVLDTRHPFARITPPAPASRGELRALGCLRDYQAPGQSRPVRWAVLLLRPERGLSDCRAPDWYPRYRRQVCCQPVRQPVRRHLTGSGRRCAAVVIHAGDQAQRHNMDRLVPRGTAQVRPGGTA